MKNRKRISLLDRICNKIFNWAAGKFLEALPVIGPLYKAVSLVNEFQTIATPKRRRKVGLAT